MKFIKISIVVLFLLVLQGLTVIGLAQSSVITGKIIDSKTKSGVADVAVFIPFTSIGATTNVLGEFIMPELRSGQYELEIRHIAYKNRKQKVMLEKGQNTVLSIIIDELAINIGEVIKKAKPADWEYGYRLFKTYFLGDTRGLSCKVENPKDLYFYYEGEALVGVSKKPLKIVNNYLGYELTFFLDFFKYIVEQDEELTIGIGDYYAFEGSSLFHAKESKSWLKKTNWRLNRIKEYQGSQRHFMSCLYSEDYTESFEVKKVWQGYHDIQFKQQLSTALLKVKTIQIDSLYTWDSRKMEPKFLYYYPENEYPIIEKMLDHENDTKKLIFTDSLFVFYDPIKTESIYNDKIATFSLSEGVIVINRDGSLVGGTGDIKWKYHDNRTRIIRMLPLNFIPPNDSIN